MQQLQTRPVLPGLKQNLKVIKSAQQLLNLKNYSRDDSAERRNDCVVPQLK